MAIPALRRSSLAAAGAVVATWSLTSAAQPVAGVALRWEAPPNCPGADDVRARIRRLLPADAAAAASKAPLLAEGTVAAANGRYRLTLRVHHDAQAGVTRSFESDSCASLAGAAAVTLALLIRGETPAEGAPAAAETATSAPSPNATNPAPAANSADTRSPTAPAANPSDTRASPAPARNAADARPPAAPAPNAADTRPPPTPPPNPPDTRPAPTPDTRDSQSGGAQSGPRRPWGIGLEAPVFAGDEGTLPSWAYGLGLAAGLHLRSLRLMLAGRYWLPQTTTTQGMFEARYTRWSGSLAGCYAWSVGPFDIGPCTALTLETVTSQGRGPQVSGGPGRESWLTVGVALRAAWTATRWAALFLRPSLTFNTARPTFVLQGVAPLYQVPLATVGVDLGCEWIL